METTEATRLGLAFAMDHGFRTCTGTAGGLVGARLLTSAGTGSVFTVAGHGGAEAGETGFGGRSNRRPLTLEFSGFARFLRGVRWNDGFDTETMLMKRKQPVYSFKAGGKVDAELPQCIKDAMNNSGWNAFGIYELVKEVLAKERAEARATKVSNV